MRFTHSKSNSLISASRTRGSANSGRRVLKTSADMPAGVSTGSSSLTHAPVADGGEVVAFRPARRVVLVAQADQARLERLEHAAGVAIIVEADLVEIIEPAIDRKIAAPIVRDRA